MDYAELGHRIRQAREKANLSQEAVAQHLGLSRSAISLIEAGRRKIDSLELRSFSQLVDKSIIFFLEEEESIETDDSLPSQVLFSANQVVDISRDRDQIEHFCEFHARYSHLARLIGKQLGPFSDQPLYNIYKPTPAAARWMANKERARLGLPVSSPVRDMQSLLEAEGVRIMAWPLTTAKLGGCFIFSKSLGSFVLVKSNIGKAPTSPGMINFVLAHEYCHHLIHRQQQGITCDPSRSYRRPEEYFAQWFAANFLMPEEALVPKLNGYLESSEGNITPEIVMNLAIDFRVSYEAMLNRMADRTVGLIDQEARQSFKQIRPTELAFKLGRSIPRLYIPYLPKEYREMAFEAYETEAISLAKLAEVLEVPLEDAQAELEQRKVPPDFGLDSEDELLRDLENA